MKVKKHLNKKGGVGKEYELDPKINDLFNKLMQIRFEKVQIKKEALVKTFETQIFADFFPSTIITKDSTFLTLDSEIKANPDLYTASFLNKIEKTDIVIEKQSSDTLKLIQLFRLYEKQNCKGVTGVGNRIKHHIIILEKITVYNKKILLFKMRDIISFCYEKLAKCDTGIISSNLTRTMRARFGRIRQNICSTVSSGVDITNKIKTICSISSVPNSSNPDEYSKEDIELINNDSNNVTTEMVDYIKQTPDAQKILLDSALVNETKTMFNAFVDLYRLEDITPEDFSTRISGQTSKSIVEARYLSLDKITLNSLSASFVSFADNQGLTDLFNTAGNLAGQSATSDFSKSTFYSFFNLTTQAATTVGTIAGDIATAGLVGIFVNLSQLLISQAINAIINSKSFRSWYDPLKKSSDINKSFSTHLTVLNHYWKEKGQDDLPTPTPCTYSSSSGTEGYIKNFTDSKKSMDDFFYMSHSNYDNYNRQLIVYTDLFLNLCDIPEVLPDENGVNDEESNSVATTEVDGEVDGEINEKQINALIRKFNMPNCNYGNDYLQKFLRFTDEEKENILKTLNLSTYNSFINAKCGSDSINKFNPFFNYLKTEIEKQKFASILYQLSSCKGQSKNPEQQKYVQEFLDKPESEQLSILQQNLENKKFNLDDDVCSSTIRGFDFYPSNYINPDLAYMAPEKIGGKKIKKSRKLRKRKTQKRRQKTHRRR
jgi:hypothetical protein